MTAREICRLALGLLSQTEEEGKELMNFSPAWLTILCAESLDVENRIRRQKGDLPLTHAPVIGPTQLDEALCYSETLCHIALPYGLAAFYYADDDNDYRAADYRARYVNALTEAEKAVFENIGDVYGEAL